MSAASPTWSDFWADIHAKGERWLPKELDRRGWTLVGAKPWTAKPRQEDPYFFSVGAGTPGWSYEHRAICAGSPAELLERIEKVELGIKERWSCS